MCCIVLSIFWFQEPDFLDDEGIYDDLDLDHEGDRKCNFTLLRSTLSAVCFGDLVVLFVFFCICFVLFFHFFIGFALVEGSMKLDDKCEDDDIQSSPGSSLNSGYSCLTTSSPASKSNNVS